MILKKKQTAVEAMLGHRGKGFLAGEHSRQFEDADRKTSGSLIHPAFERLRRSERSMGFARSPNKSPEPTLTLPPFFAQAANAHSSQEIRVSVAHL